MILIRIKLNNAFFVLNIKKLQDVHAVTISDNSQYLIILTEYLVPFLLFWRSYGLFHFRRFLLQSSVAKDGINYEKYNKDEGKALRNTKYY